jgi:hypothetical protein
MKIKISILMLAICVAGMISTLSAQDYADSLGVQKYRITKQDGGVLVGKMRKNDAVEVILVTDNIGEVVIPKHVIREIKALQEDDFLKDGSIRANNGFHTRYFLTTNGFGLKKNESYVQWNLYGPDFQVAINDRITAGLVTSWIGVPLIGSVKTTFPVGEGVRMGVGALAGTGSYAAPSFFFTLPFAAVTVGYQRFSTGGFITSFGGVAELTPKLAFVFDSFFLMNQAGGPLSAGFIIPGLRWNQNENKAFQIGFAGIINDGRAAPIPLPMLQWFRRL